MEIRKVLKWLLDNQQMVAQLQQQQQLWREVLALRQVLQEHLVQQGATLMQPTIPLAWHACRPRPMGSLMEPLALQSKIGHINNPKDAGRMQERNPRRPKVGSPEPQTRPTTTGETMTRRHPVGPPPNQGKSSPQGRPEVTDPELLVRAGEGSCDGVCNYPFVDCSWSQALATGSRARQRGPPKLVVTIWVESTLVTALGDSGYSQTLIQADLVESHNPAEVPILLHCIQGEHPSITSCLGTAGR